MIKSHRSELIQISKGNLISNLREKGRYLTRSYDKSPYTSRNFKRAKWQHKQRHKKDDYTAVADRLENHIKDTYLVSKNAFDMVTMVLLLTVWSIRENIYKSGLDMAALYHPSSLGSYIVLGTRVPGYTLNNPLLVPRYLEVRCVMLNNQCFC